MPRRAVAQRAGETYEAWLQRTHGLDVNDEAAVATAAAQEPQEPAAAAAALSSSEDEDADMEHS